MGCYPLGVTLLGPSAALPSSSWLGGGLGQGGGTMSGGQEVEWISHWKVGTSFGSSPRTVALFVR